MTFERATTRGRLLVATPPLEDPNFDRTVVYMLEHKDEGAIGVVLNRPGAELDRLVDDVKQETPLAPWLHLVTAPRRLFDGGPVGAGSIVAVARGHGRDDEHWSAVTGDVGSVDLSVDPTDVAERVDDLRLFSGYSGWAPSQLETELADGAWMVFDASNDDVFSTTPTELWRTVIRRQGGHLRWIADAPDDLAAN